MTRHPVDVHAHFYPEELIAVWREESSRFEGNARRLLAP